MKKQKKLGANGANCRKAPFLVEPPTPPVEEEPENEDMAEDPIAEDIDFTEENPEIADEDINNLLADIMSQDVDNLPNDYDNFDDYNNDDNI